MTSHARVVPPVTGVSPVEIGLSEDKRLLHQCPHCPPPCLDLVGARGVLNECRTPLGGLTAQETPSVFLRKHPAPALLPTPEPSDTSHFRAERTSRHFLLELRKTCLHSLSPGPACPHTSHGPRGSWREPKMWAGPSGF